MIEVISVKQVKTRKPHQCWGCAKTFPVGSDLWCCVNKEDVIVRSYWCQDCQEFVENDSDFQDGYVFGELAGFWGIGGCDRRQAARQ